MTLKKVENQPFSHHSYKYNIKEHNIPQEWLWDNKEGFTVAEWLSLSKRNFRFDLGDVLLFPSRDLRWNAKSMWKLQFNKLWNQMFCDAMLLWVCVVFCIVCLPLFLCAFSQSSISSQSEPLPIKILPESSNPKKCIIRKPHCNVFMLLLLTTLGCIQLFWGPRLIINLLELTDIGFGSLFK